MSHGSKYGPLVRGEQNIDCMLFWEYYSSGVEHWVTPATFRAKTEVLRRKLERNRETTKERTRLFMRNKYRNGPPEYRAQILEKNKQWYQANKSKETYRLVKRRASSRLHRLPKHKAVKCAYVKRRRAEDPIFKLRMLLRERIRSFIKSKGLKKDTSTTKLLGCSLGKLKEHIER